MKYKDLAQGQKFILRPISKDIDTAELLSKTSINGKDAITLSTAKLMHIDPEMPVILIEY